MRRALTALFIALACPAQVTAQHVWYKWTPAKSEQLVQSMHTVFRWTQMAVGNVFFATQFFTPTQGGYFGAQCHEDGTQMILFSLWDFNNTYKNAWGISPWCGRFGGEGEGSHCGLMYPMLPGVDYEFHVAIEGRNKTGTFIGASIKDGLTKQSMPIGQIWYEDVEGHGVAELGSIRTTSVSFQEYYTSGTFYSSGGFSGPFFGEDPEGPGAPADADADCDDISKVSACIPGKGCGRPHAHFEKGGMITKECGPRLWQSPECRWQRCAPTLPSLPFPLPRGGRIPFKPTATSPTGTGRGAEGGHEGEEKGGVDPGMGSKFPGWSGGDSFRREETAFEVKGDAEELESPAAVNSADSMEALTEGFFQGDGHSGSSVTLTHEEKEQRTVWGGQPPEQAKRGSEESLVELINVKAEEKGKNEKEASRIPGSLQTSSSFSSVSKTHEKGKDSGSPISERLQVEGVEMREKTRGSRWWVCLFLHQPDCQEGTECLN
mmetsp:Transcript_55432/g.108515  ORF Transcript_55432/g.108515 Transcript_55432/m.108515 type:complete len:491 (-) Transcript_55432:121-1593(-)